jgi:hypothetical protein
LQTGARQRARHALEAAETALRCPELDLPLTGARQSLAAAWTALNKGDHPVVGELLQVATDNVMLLAGAGEPLVTAKTLLWRACRAATTGRPEQVNRYLVQALTSLSQAETISGDANSRCRVGELRDQIGALSNDGWQPTLLEPLWWRTQALAERVLEYRALRWQCQQPDSAYKAALIEAKCHLVYAETSQAITEPADTAMTELQRVSACLEQAAATAGPRPRARIASLREPLQRLVVAADDRSPAAAYQSLQAGLRQLLGLG